MGVGVSSIPCGVEEYVGPTPHLPHRQDHATTFEMLMSLIIPQATPFPGGTFLRDPLKRSSGAVSSIGIRRGWELTASPPSQESEHLKKNFVKSFDARLLQDPLLSPSR